MSQYFHFENMTKLIVGSTTTVTLPSGSNLRLGGQGYALSSNLTCNLATTGFGGLDTGALGVSLLYYVYAVRNAGLAVGLVASLSATAPSGFTAYRKIGAFITDTTSLVFRTYFFNEINNITYTADGNTGSTGWTMTPANWIASQTSLGTGRTQLNPTAGIFSVTPSGVASPTQASIGQHVYVESSSATAIVVRGSNATPALSAEQGTVNIAKTGVDAIQPDWTRDS